MSFTSPSNYMAARSGLFSQKRPVVFDSHLGLEERFGGGLHAERPVQGLHKSVSQYISARHGGQHLVEAMERTVKQMTEAATTSSAWRDFGGKQLSQANEAISEVLDDLLCTDGKSPLLSASTETLASFDLREGSIVWMLQLRSLLAAAEREWAALSFDQGGLGPCIRWQNVLEGTAAKLQMALQLAPEGMGASDGTASSPLDSHDNSSCNSSVCGSSGGTASSIAGTSASSSTSSSYSAGHKLVAMRSRMQYSTHWARKVVV